MDLKSIKVFSAYRPSSDWPGLSDRENKEHRFRAVLDIGYGVYLDLW